MSGTIPAPNETCNPRASFDPPMATAPAGGSMFPSRSYAMPCVTKSDSRPTPGRLL